MVIFPVRYVCLAQGMCHNSYPTVVHEMGSQNVVKDLTLRSSEIAIEMSILSIDDFPIKTSKYRRVPIAMLITGGFLFCWVYLHTWLSRAKDRIPIGIKLSWSFPLSLPYINHILRWNDLWSAAVVPLICIITSFSWFNLCRVHPRLPWNKHSEILWNLV